MVEMNINKGKIILISGPSGVGKKTVLDEILNNKNLNIVYSISATTRPKRHNEIHGKDYYFLSHNEFKNGINQGDFLEYAEFCGNYYGTPKQKIFEQLNQGKNVLLEIETLGAKNIMQQFDKDEIISIFLIPPSLEILKQRLINRGTETLETIDKRVKKASDELKHQDMYQNIVVNDDVNQTIKEITKIIEQSYDKK